MGTELIKLKQIIREVILESGEIKVGTQVKIDPRILKNGRLLNGMAIDWFGGDMVIMRRIFNSIVGKKFRISKVKNGQYYIKVGTFKRRPNGELILRSTSDIEIPIDAHYLQLQ